jgi:hypothetical protein
VLEPVDKPTRQHIINRYHKIYVCRHPPRRQIRWQPILVGQKDQLEIEEVLETCRSSPLEQIEGVMATDIVDRSGGHSRKPVFGFSMSTEAATGGVAAADSGG